MNIKATLTYKDDVFKIPEDFKSSWFHLVLHSISIEKNRLVIKFKPELNREDISVDMCQNIGQLRSNLKGILIEKGIYSTTLVRRPEQIPFDVEVKPSCSVIV